MDAACFQRVGALVLALQGALACSAPSDDASSSAGGTTSGGGSGTAGTSSLSGGTGGSSLSGSGGVMSGSGGVSAGGVSAGGASSGGSAITGSLGCGMTPSATGTQMGNITASGTSRTYEYVVPSTYDPNTPIPVTFGFHGRGGDHTQPDAWGMHTAAAAADQNGIFIYPDGLDQGGGTGWNEDESGEDVALFDALLAWAGENFCIDETRVFAAGFSWGNDFSNTLGCYRGDEIRGINGFSGGLYNNDCGDVAPAYRATYSTPDGTDAYSQGAIDKAVNFYREMHGCGDATEAILPTPCQEFQGCELPVVICPYAQMGHNVPYNGGKDAWDFFMSL